MGVYNKNANECRVAKWSDYVTFGYFLMRITVRGERFPACDLTSLNAGRIRLCHNVASGGTVL